MTPLRLAWRQLRRGVVVWAAAASALVAIGIAVFETTYRTPVQRRILAETLGRTPAIDSLYGRAVAIDTAGGFMAWRYGTVLTTMVSLWALLATTSILRGDEEKGRSDLLLTGHRPARVLLGDQLVATAVAVVLVACAPTVACLAGGLPAAGSLRFGMAVGGGALFFASLAAVTSQILPTRRRASGWAGGALAVAYLVRAVGDSDDSRRWLTWFSPIGWCERVSPFHRPQWAPLVLLAGTSVGLALVAVLLRGHRDTGAGIVEGRLVERAARRPPRSVLALQWFLERGTAVAWAAVMALGGIVLGLLAGDLVRYLRDDSSAQAMMRRYAGRSILTVEGYLGICFGAIGAALGLFVVAQVVSGREEEVGGRLDLLLAGGAGRVRWLVSRIVVALVAMPAVLAAFGVGAWLGVRAGGGSVGVWAATRGALNVLPLAIVFGGAAVAVFGWLPRATAAVGYGFVGAAYLIQSFGALGDVPQWVRDLSPLTHVQAVPGAPADVGALAVLSLSGAALGLLGLVGFRLRDLRS